MFYLRGFMPVILHQALGPLLALLFCGWSVLAQASHAPPEQIPQPASVSQSTNQQNSPAGGAANDVFKVTTRMVLVDAVVTDGSGKPVAGLKSGDFQIFENGKPEQIRAFGARSPELQQRQTSATVATHTLPPGLFTNITDFHPEYGPLTIILIDSLNTPYFDQPYMRDAVIKYLQGVGPRQNFLIFTLGIRLGLVQNLNADPQLLQEALQRIASDPTLKKKSKPRAPGDDQDSRVRALAQDLLGIGAAYDKESQIVRMEDSLIEFFPDQGVVQVDNRVSATLDALKRIAHTVGGYPGRKNLIWLSAAFPLFINPIAAGLADARNYQPEVQEAANLLTDNEVAVYPVDVRGLVGNFLPDASSDSQRHGMLGGRQVAGVVSSRSVALSESHAAMDHLADQTGGRAYYNRNDIEHGIATSVQDGSTYYSLGYYPADKNWDGKFRKIEVKVARSGLHVHYRRGYYAVDRRRHTVEEDKAARREFVNALALDAPAATDLPLVAHVDPPNQEHSQVFVNIGLDPHAVTFESQAADRQEAQVEFTTVVVDANGKLITSKADILNTALTPQTFTQVMSGSLVVRQKFDLSPGNYLLRIGVHDLKSHLIGVLTAKVEVSSPKSD
jgi:VWFA-related protein